MKAALIPPIPELATYGRGDFHLLLSHLLSNDDYRAHYAGERIRGAYLVLDNSAHEFRIGETAKQLREQAVWLNAQEVVIPDALEDGPKTVDLALKTLEAWYEKDQNQQMLQLNPALMYVPQGKDEAEWRECLAQLIEAHTFMAKKIKGFRRSFVLGVSKDYDVWEGGLKHLLATYVHPLKDKLWLEREIKMQVHMLGWTRDLWNLNEWAQEFPWLRSTDSAKPFVYARAGTTLSARQPVPPYPARPSDYFEVPLTTQQRKIATRNVHIFQLAAGGKLL